MFSVKYAQTANHFDSYIKNAIKRSVLALLLTLLYDNITFFDILFYWNDFHITKTSI